MCYDIAYLITLESVEDYFGDIVFDDPQLPFDFDVSIHVLAQAYKKGLVVVKEGEVYRGKLFEWGVIAPYMDTPEKIRKMRSSMCNIRSEKIGDRKAFWHRIRNNRCLVPVTGFYEHREIKGWKNKVPYYIRLKERDMFCIPGLYSYSPVPDPETGELKGTYAVITRAANSVMGQIHNGGDNAGRMPLLLPKEMEMQWLDPDLDEAGMQSILDYEMPAEALDYHTVYTIRTTKPHPQGGHKNDPFEWPNLPPLGNDEGEMQKALF